MRALKMLCLVTCLAFVGCTTSSDGGPGDGPSSGDASDEGDTADAESSSGATDGAGAIDRAIVDDEYIGMRM